MRTIKDILHDYDCGPTASAPKPSTHQVHDHVRASGPDLTLTPVREVEAKVRPAAFTTVPSPDTSGAGVQIIRTGMPAERPTPQERATASAEVAEPKPQKRIRLKVPTVLRKLSPRWSAIAVLFACAMLYPALIVLPVFGAFVLIIGAFVLFGAERVWDRVGQALARYEARAPRKTARLMVRFDLLAVRWDAVLDHFPEGWVEGLYLPDFANRQERSRNEDAKVIARLQRMHSQV